MQIAGSVSGASWRKAFRNVFARQIVRQPQRPIRIKRQAAPKRSPSFKCPKWEIWGATKSVWHRPRCRMMNQHSSSQISIDDRRTRKRTKERIARRTRKTKPWRTRHWWTPILTIRFRFFRSRRETWATTPMRRRLKWRSAADSSTTTLWRWHRTSTDSSSEIWWVQENHLRNNFWILLFPTAQIFSLQSNLRLRW